MSRIIPFSTRFPAYHPKAGQPTYFVEQILNSLGIPYSGYKQLLQKLNPDLPEKVIDDFINSISKTTITGTKLHTIRGGTRWKAGDKFSPRIWISRPYFPNFYEGKRIPSQLIFAPDQEVKKTWPFEATKEEYYLDGLPLIGKIELVNRIAANDGLHWRELFDWFDKPMEGQVICWSETVNY